MIPHLFPADELALIRSQIRHLRKREAELCEALAVGAVQASGYLARAEVQRTTHKVFLRQRLPEAILTDPGFWEEKHQNSVVIHRIDEAEFGQEGAGSWSEAGAPGQGVPSRGAA